MADSFYMVLPSHASNQTFPDNRPGLYRIQLPEMMHLKGPWKVGLMNLTFPSTFAPSHGPLTIKVSLGDNKNLGTLNLAVKGIVETVWDLFEAMKKTLEKRASDLGLTLSDHMTFLYTSTVQIRTFRGSMLGFNAYLARKLGLLTDNHSIPITYYKKVSFRDGFVFVQQDNEVRLKVSGEDALSLVPSLKEKIVNLYVYTDLVEPHPVGDTQANLLRIVPIKEENEQQIVSEEFTVPLYFGLSRLHFNTVTVLITDDNGNEVPFEDASVQVTLHFDRSVTH